jgi:hypothetical protein
MYCESVYIGPRNAGEEMCDSGSGTLTRWNEVRIRSNKSMRVEYLFLRNSYAGGRKAERWEELIRFFVTMQETRKELYCTKDVSI